MKMDEPISSAVPVTESSEMKESEQLSEMKESEQLSEMKDSEQLSEMKESEELSEMKDSEQSSEMKDSEQPSERKDSEQSSEVKDSEQPSEMKDSEQSGEMKESKQSSEMKESEQSSERKDSEQSSEMKELEHMKESDQSSEMKESEQSSEMKESEQSSEMKKSEQSSEMKKLEEMKESEQSNDVCEKAPEPFNVQEQCNDNKEVSESIDVEGLSINDKEASESIAVEGLANDDKEVPPSAPPPEEVNMEDVSNDSQEVPPSTTPPEDVNMEELSNDIEKTPPPVPDPELNGISENPDDIKEDSNEDNKEVPMEVVKDDKECLPAKLVIKGYENEEEECPMMTIEEAQDFIMTKVESKFRDSNINPILILHNRIKELEDDLRNKAEEFSKLNKLMESLYKDHVKFLRHVGSMAKVESKTVSIGVDLPWLPETVAGFVQNDGKAKTDGSQPAAIKPKKDGGPVECIDLTDDVDMSNKTPPKPASAKADGPTFVTTNPSSVSITPMTRILSGPAKANQHPAPLPSTVIESSATPPKPRLKISVDKNGIVLQWDMPPQAKNLKISGFEIYGYQEKNNVLVSSSLWKKIGCVNPMPLPMSCTLTQFVEGYKYHFSIRSITSEMPGHFSDPASIMFFPEKKKI